MLESRHPVYPDPAGLQITRSFKKSIKIQIRADISEATPAAEMELVGK